MDILCFNPFNLKNKILKIHGPPKILKNISWPINICLKYFMTPIKTLPPPPPTYLMYGPQLKIFFTKHPVLDFTGKFFKRFRRAFKGATKMYFKHYSCVVIILFNTGLCSSAFSGISFRKLAFCACFASIH